MSGFGGGERDLTAVLIGACVGSMTVLLFTIGILAFIYWCCFRERLRWWRKFENAAVVIGNPAAANAAAAAASMSARSTRSNKAPNPPSGHDSSTTAPLAAVSTISGSILQRTNEITVDYGSKHHLPTEAMTGHGSLIERGSLLTPTNPILISAMKGSGLSSSQLVIKRSSLNVANNSGTAERANYKSAMFMRQNGQMGMGNCGGKVRPGLSLVALPTSNQISHLQQQQQYLNSKQQQRLMMAQGNALAPMNNNNNNAGIVRRASRQAKNLPGVKQDNNIVRVRGISVPCEVDSPSEEAGGDDSQPGSSTASSFAASAKRWSSMPVIDAFGDFMSRERDRIVQRTASKRAALCHQNNNNNNNCNNNNNNIEEVSTSWRGHNLHNSNLSHQISNSSRSNNRRNASRRQTTCILPLSLINNQNKLTEVPGSPNFDENVRKPENKGQAAPSVANKQQTEKQQMAMLMMTREAQYTFTADDDEDDDDESSSPEFFRKPPGVPIETPPPTVSAIVGVIPQRLHAAYGSGIGSQPNQQGASKNSSNTNNSNNNPPTTTTNSSGEYGSHSSRISGDDSAIVIIDSAQSTSSKNGTDGEQSSSPQTDQRLSTTNQQQCQPPPVDASSDGLVNITKPSILTKPSALKKPNLTKPSQQIVTINSFTAEIEVDTIRAHPMSPLSPDDNNNVVDGIITNNGGDGQGGSCLKVDEDAVSSSMRSKIAKIRRYKQRSRTTGVGLGANGMGNMRSLSVAELSRPAMRLAAISAASEEAPGDMSASRSAPRPPIITPRRLTGEVAAGCGFTYAPASSTITGHTIGVHVDNLVIGRPIVAPLSPTSGMRRYATMEALTTDRGDGVYMGRIAASVAAAAAAAAAANGQNNNTSNNNNPNNNPNNASNGLPSSDNSEAGSVATKDGNNGSNNKARIPVISVMSTSSGSLTSPVVKAGVQSNGSTLNVVTNEPSLGARITVNGGQGGQDQTNNSNGTSTPTLNNGGVRTAPIVNNNNKPSTPIRRGDYNNNGSISGGLAPAAATIYSPHSASYNVEQATRQHQQQQQLLTRAVANNQRQQIASSDAVDEDEDDATAYSVDQAKLVTENAFRFLNEFSEADTNSQRSAEDGHDESSHADSELSESFQSQPYYRDVQIPTSSSKPQQQLINPASTRGHRGSPAPISARQFKQQELRLGDWL